jgi:hypothetical protein
MRDRPYPLYSRQEPSRDMYPRSSSSAPTTDAPRALECATAVAEDYGKAAIERLYAIVRLWEHYDEAVEACWRVGALTRAARSAGSVVDEDEASKVAEALKALEELHTEVLTKEPRRSQSNQAPGGLTSTRRST